MSVEPSPAEWGSDAIAEMLRSFGAPYFVFNPGASYRGLHDSLVNHLHAERPDLVMCLHEEHAVAIAHGWAKVTGSPLVVGLHSNVGLMHAAMAVYNAWCDRVPMLLVGANGPLDATRRRPWIDWIHTTADQASIVRPYTKWDDQPLSVEATLDALARAWDITRTSPHGPTYVVLDAQVQESPLTRAVPLPRVSGTPTAAPVADAATVDRVVDLLQAAERPVILSGRIGRDDRSWSDRVRIAEATGARVVTDLKAGAGFPTEHPAHVPGTGFFLAGAGRDALSAADVVVALDWIDVAGTLAQAPADGTRVVVDVTRDRELHGGWSKDGFARVAADLVVPVDADVFAAQLAATLPVEVAAVTSPRPAEQPRLDPEAPLALPDLAAALRWALRDTPTTLVRLPLGWDGDAWPFESAADFLGYDGGGGIGSGPGMLVGAGLALRGTDRLAVGVLGDGDYLMGVQALWTAAHEGIPLLAIVANNRSYFNDEVHQERVATLRGRDASRRWIGQRIDDPAPDLAALARAQGLVGLGPVLDGADLLPTLERAVELAAGGQPVVVDVVVRPGYSPAMAAGLARDH